MIDLLAFSDMLVLCHQCGSDGEFCLSSGTDVGGGFAHPHYESLQFVKVKCSGCNSGSEWRHLNKDTLSQLYKRWNDGNVAPQNTYNISLPSDAPIIVNYGGGVDSTAMLIGLYRAGIRPDLIMFADTGGEKPETYQYIDYFNKWLKSIGFPLVTKVKYQPVSAPYDSLEGNCLANDMLPSLAYRRKSCSLKFKAQVMDGWLLGKKGPNACDGWEPALESLARHAKPVKLIGYDNGPADSRRAVKLTEDKYFRYEHPLRQLGWAREDCILEILKEGLIVPLKSACFFCPASKDWELFWLAAEHPDHFIRAIEMEDNARDGKHGFTAINGLWGHDISWRSWAEDEGILEGDKIVASREFLLSKTEVNLSLLENNLGFGLAMLGHL